MTDQKLKATLHLIVQEYGLGMVLRSLAEITDVQNENLERLAASSGGTASRTAQSRPKITAPKYVKMMELPTEKSAAVTELAERFHSKSFLPTFADIASFCDVYMIELPASRSRVNAIRRIFKFIATMQADEIQRILDEEMFSGPSRLGPIADAIRNYGSGESQRSTR